MKKIKLLLILGILSTLLAACGKETVNEAENLNKADTVLDTEDTDQVDLSVNTEGALLGVYDGVYDYTEIPMGTFFEGSQRAFCKIKVPLEYLISAIYSIDGSDTDLNPKAQAVLVKNYDPEQDEVVNKEVLLGSTEGTKLNFYIVPSTAYTMEDEKTVSDEYKEIGSGDHKGIYYVHPSEYVTADLIVDYQINDDILLKITYEGPLADSLGLDQLAQNIYNLVTVIE